MNKRLIIIVTVIFVAMLILISCSEPSTTPTPSLTPTPTLSPTQTLTPRYGGDLKIITTKSPLKLGYPPGMTMKTELVMASCAIDRLILPDEQGRPVVPCLATAWENSPDGKSITFTLREGVKFHDGTNFNAEVVKYNLDIYRESSCVELNSVTSVDVLDDYTVRLNLSQPDPFILGYLSQGTGAGYIISKKALERGADWCAANPVGTGPFEFVSMERDVSVLFKRFDGYWQEGKPYLYSIEFIIIKEAMVAKTSFMAGEAHMIFDLSVSDLDQLRDTGKYVVNTLEHAIYGLAGDSANSDSPFADIKVRQAVSYAIDSKAIAQGLGSGMQQASNQPVPEENFFYNPAVDGYPYDPQKAKDLLAEAGYAGFSMKIIYPTQNTAYEAVQGYLQAIGINATIDMPGRAAFSEITTGGWHNGMVMYLCSCWIGTEPLTTFGNWLSDASPLYPSILHPADYQAKLEHALLENDLEKRRVLTQELIKLIVDDYCLATYIVSAINGSARYSMVHDTMLYELWLCHWTPENAWLSK